MHTGRTRKLTVTMLDIAKRTRVSQATVSRVLSGKGIAFISPRTREKVLAAAAELGYEVNPIAQSLVTGRTHVVALWIRNPDAQYYARILRAAQEAVRADGYEMLLAGFRDRGEPDGPGACEPGSKWVVGAWPVDGVLAADCSKMSQAFLRARRGRSAALVGMGSDYLTDGDYIGCNHAQGVEKAVQHLVDIGCKRIAHLTGDCAISRVRCERASTYERVIRAAGQVPDMITATDESRAAARHAVSKRFREPPLPDGLFCLNDDLAIGAYRGMRDIGLRIPEDCALVGCDGIADTEFMDVPITTILQPVEDMAKLAWSALRRRMERPTSPRTQTVLAPQLIVRESTGRMPH